MVLRWNETENVWRWEWREKLIMPRGCLVHLSVSKDNNKSHNCRSRYSIHIHMKCINLHLHLFDCFIILFVYCASETRCSDTTSIIYHEINFCPRQHKSSGSKCSRAPLRTLRIFFSYQKWKCQSVPHSLHNDTEQLANFCPKLISSGIILCPNI